MAEIYTTLGMMDEALLQRTDGTDDDFGCSATWQEWRFNGEIVKREAQIVLHPVSAASDVAEIG